MKPESRLKPLDSPSPIQVWTEPEGRPVAVLRRPRGSRGGTKVERVAAIREVWRIDEEWWRRPISRLYREVVLENGRVSTLYLDLVEGGWWEQ